MRESNLKVKKRVQVHLQIYTTTNSQHTLRTYENLTLLIGLAQGTMNITDPKDTTILIYTIMGFRELAHAQLIASGYSIHVTDTLVYFKPFTLPFLQLTFSKMHPLWRKTFTLEKQISSHLFALMLHVIYQR